MFEKLLAAFVFAGGLFCVLIYTVISLLLPLTAFVALILGIFWLCQNL